MLSISDFRIKKQSDTRAPSDSSVMKENKTLRSDKSQYLETTLTGPVQGKLITEQQLIRDSLFIIQNIDGHYIKWSESQNKYQLVPHVKCNICDASMVDKLSFLGFLGKFLHLDNFPKQF